MSGSAFRIITTRNMPKPFGQASAQKPIAHTKVADLYEKMSIIGRAVITVADILIPKSSDTITARIDKIKNNIEQLIYTSLYLKPTKLALHKELSDLKEYIASYKSYLSKNMNSLSKFYIRDKADGTEKFIKTIPFNANIESNADSIGRLKCIETRLKDVKTKIESIDTLQMQQSDRATIFSAILDILETVRTELTAEFKHCEDAVLYLRTIEKFYVERDNEITYYLRTTFDNLSIFGF
jgi:hypothetical protein